MFEVNLFTPAQFGAFIAWLTIWRGPLSVLIHPNTVEEPSDAAAAASGYSSERRDHTQRATWMGERVPLDLDLFAAISARKQKERAAAAAAGTA